MDSEELLVDSITSLKKIKSDDLFEFSGKIYDEMKIKIAFILFCIYIITNLDIYYENILSPFVSNTYDAASDKPSTKGVIISGIIMSVSYILIDFMYDHKVI